MQPATDCACHVLPPVSCAEARTTWSRGGRRPGSCRGSCREMQAEEAQAREWERPCVLPAVISIPLPSVHVMVGVLHTVHQPNPHTQCCTHGQLRWLHLALICSQGGLLSPRRGLPIAVPVKQYQAVKGALSTGTADVGVRTTAHACNGCGNDQRAKKQVNLGVLLHSDSL